MSGHLVQFFQLEASQAVGRNVPNDMVMNIDATDKDSELAATEYIDDIYKFYKLSEDDCPVHDYMVSQPDINAKMRAILVDWKEVWFTFPRQDEAVKFAKEQEDVHLFSYQDHFNGQRRFLVSTYTEFWRRSPTLRLMEHTVAVKAIAWSPHQINGDYANDYNISANGSFSVEFLFSSIDSMELVCYIYFCFSAQGCLVA
ncbi:G2/mitotic-specific cyclin-2-like isoform X2 [Vicia villosa]|uniref:G2/mitotic-specific cyclin-2-like isoform X2 n=1 Tax=Vicia villosa TaxID=3911 RepID=UPI00273AC1AC|nr:G2/mitotic-specific cyclin-2-like isoform X2 [Vicia villosa]